MRAAGAIALFALGGLGGCRAVTPPAAPLPRPPRCPFPLSAPIAPSALGFSLALSARELPAVPVLAALIERHGAGVEIRLAPKGDGRIDLATIAGAPPCALPEERLTLAGPALRFRPMHATAEERDREGRRALAAKQFPEARAALAAAALLEPELPERAARVGDSYVTEGRWREAVAIYRDTVTRFPWSYPVRARLALALRRDDQLTDALRELGRALALRPGAGELLAAAARERLLDLSPPVPPPAERGDGGLWLVRPTPGAELHGREEARLYARCKETFRSSELLRITVTGEDGPWRWSPAEETLCTALWLAAYADHREDGRLADAALERLWEGAQAGALDERSVLDVGAIAHPLLPAFVDPKLRERLFAFTLRYRVVMREGGLFD